jgi:uncharacterized protein YkwD
MPVRTAVPSLRARGVARQAAPFAALAGLLFAGPVLASDTSLPAARLASAATHLSVEGRAGADTGLYVRKLALLINEYRSNRGLAPLELASELNELASEHSSQMAEQRRLSHDGFRERFDRARARLCVENVGVNFPHGEAQLDGWRASPGHHRNLLEPKVARMGIARSASFVTFFACG